MSEEKYTIKEAAKLVGVEAHVLRYWEEELELQIMRNDMGHRYYKTMDVKILQKVKELKDKGIQLKCIHDMVDRLYRIIRGEEEMPKDLIYEETGDILEEKTVEEKNNPLKENEKNNREDKQEINENNVVDFKMAQFQNMMSKMINNSIKDNIGPLSNAITASAVTDVVKQMDMLIKEKEEREEARYRKLDETLREIQLARKEIAVTEAELGTKRDRKRRKLGKNA